MQSALSQAFSEPLLAAMPQLSEKPHLGVPSSNPALYQGHEVCNSTTALGLRAASHLERARSRSTGKERDTESGNDYFGARYYASSMGRFMSPDPLPWPHWQSGSEDDQKRFSAFIMNPQNLNAYVYVLNNPLTSVDPDGMQVYVVAYTTGNSEGDDELKRAAQTKKDEITSSKGFDPKKDTVIMGGVKTKEDFQNLLSSAAKVSDQFGQTSSVSLFSHSGDLDGPVFHDAAGHPSQMTKGEMSNLKVNWSSNATASFFGCRSADNFAQNFANAQHVRTFGFVGGVDFSGNPNSVSKWYVLTGQFQRYMVDKGEQGLKERDPQ
jgi:RHS repeat-associated protein